MKTAEIDIADGDALRALLAGHFAVLSAAPYHLTTLIAEAAADAKVHYLDLTEDVEFDAQVREIAARGELAFIPQCGLAPGFISIVANDLASRFDTLDSVRMRVGALPQYPSNALNYNLTWSTDGVINEYIEHCEAIVDGELVEVPALEEREEFSLDGVTYEAFNTSGGLGTLCETLKGKVRTLNYRTIRYPGHAAIMKALLNDLGLRHRREVLKDILENALPTTMQDVVIIFVTVSGRSDGRLVQETYAHKVYSGPSPARCTAPSRSPRRPASARCSTCSPRAACRRAASSGRRRSAWPTSWPTASAATTPRTSRRGAARECGRARRFRQPFCFLFKTNCDRPPEKHGETCRPPAPTAVVVSTSSASSFSCRHARSPIGRAGRSSPSSPSRPTLGVYLALKDPALHAGAKCRARRLNIAGAHGAHRSRLLALTLLIVSALDHRFDCRSCRPGIVLNALIAPD